MATTPVEIVNTPRHDATRAPVPASCREAVAIARGPTCATARVILSPAADGASLYSFTLISARAPPAGEPDTDARG
ncbi:MAG: hypothetical protein WCK40_10350 [Thermoleophilia bacterium]